MIKVTVWNEYAHEKTEEKVRELYPDGIHEYIKSFLDKNEDITVRTATLDDPECGLTEDVLADTDVLFWWGHMKHGDVPDEIVDRVYNEVHKGMGLIVLHSGHHSKIFRKLMGTTCNLQWRDGDRERIWCCKPSHPIAQGIPQMFEIDVEEMYGECFDIPNPEDIIFMGWFSGGEVFRSGCTFTRGNGKIFYFQPGHEDNPTYHNEIIQRIITNATRWAAPTYRVDELTCPHASIPPEDKYK